MALNGTELVEVFGNLDNPSASAAPAAVAELVPVQAIADLASIGAITSAAMTAWVLTLPTTETAGGLWLNGNVLCYGIVTP